MRPAIRPPSIARPRAAAVAVVLLLLVGLALPLQGAAKPGKRLPDLVVQAAGFDGEPQDGAEHGASATVENLGAPTSSDLVVRFAVDGVALGDAVVPSGLQGQAVVQAPQRWTATAGRHTLRVEVDALRQVTERDESNNVLLHDVEVAPAPADLPDLRIRDIGFVDAFDQPPQPGQENRAWAVVENLGAATTADAWVAFDVDHSQLGSAWIPAGYTGTVTFHSPMAWTMASGPHVLRVRADPEGNVAEGDEGNNDRTLSFTVPGETTPPELQFQYVSWNGTPQEGVAIDAYASIRNTGTPTEAPAVVRFRIDDTPLGETTAPAGWTGVITVSSPGRWTVTPGWHTLHAEIDPDGAFAEPDETNNVIAWDFQVHAATDLPDLRPTGAELTWYPYFVGDRSDITAYVENVGPPTTTDVYVEFFVDGESLGMALMSAGFDDQSMVRSPGQWTATEGTHVIRVVMDATGAQAEADEGNNVFERTYVVKNPPEPEILYTWQSGGASPEVTSATLSLPVAYMSVAAWLDCGTATVTLQIDGEPVASCLAGTATPIEPHFLEAGDHVVLITYAGPGPASLEIWGTQAVTQ